jgi:glycerol kinase
MNHAMETDLRSKALITPCNARMQFQADILNAIINRRDIEEVSALAVYKNPDEIAKLRTSNDFITGNLPSEKVTVLYNGWKEAVKRAIN